MVGLKWLQLRTTFSFSTEHILLNLIEAANDAVVAAERRALNEIGVVLRRFAAGIADDCFALGFKRLDREL